MNVLSNLGLKPGRTSELVDLLPKYERTPFDYAVILFAYLFAPLGLILALVRFFGTHYKNYRKAVNHSLLYHVFVGGFVELTVAFGAQLMDGELDASRGDLLFMLGFLAVIFLLPASLFARYAAQARYNFARLAKQYIALITEDGIRYTGNLAERTGQSERDVRRDLLYLGKYGLLGSGTQTDEGPESAAAAAGEEAGGGQRYSASEAQPSPKPLPKSIRCPGCGARNLVQPVQTKSCDYCGTAIPYC
ncbi:hypothetical protein [Paenibacillus tengchongensis]|uniref:hypothetical protein n=1 Tax=Paenibacillus tengchongensis TaxID=2608684 RepID=UPI00124EF959|nr:hypothetical protein [Paenibacillus tengchongensis]